MAKQQDAYKELESQLITGFGGFDYKDIGTVAETYWNLTYKTLEEGKKYRESVAEIAEAKNLSDSIRLDLSILNTRLYGYYGKILHEEDGLSTDDSRDLIIAELQEQIERLPSALAENARLALAKVYVWSQMYVEAEHMAREIIERKAVILNEANLIAAIAQYKTGKEMEALQNINIVREALSLPTIVPPIDNDVLIETAHRCLIGDGQLYPYYRLLGKNINYMETVANFNPDRHFYLPIPQAALDTYPGLVQNAGY